jgi:hypothetical protein
MFDARRFLEDHFQNVGGLIAHCRAMGIEPPSEAQAAKWFGRCSLPGDWLAKLLGLLEAERGEAVSVKPYLGAM